MALRRARSCSMGAPGREEGRGKMCWFEGSELPHSSKLQLPHPARCLFGNLGLWVLWVGSAHLGGKAQHKISSPSQTIQPLNPKGITALRVLLHLRSATGSLKILIWLLSSSRVLLSPSAALTRSPPNPPETSLVMQFSDQGRKITREGETFGEFSGSAPWAAGPTLSACD